MTKKKKCMILLGTSVGTYSDIKCHDYRLILYETCFRKNNLSRCFVFLSEICYRRKHENLLLRSKHAPDIYRWRTKIRHHSHESHVGCSPGRPVS